jgi:hypothetical protein
MAILFALALLATDPTGPVSTAPVPPVPAPPVAAQAASDFTRGAPTDDYGFVAWCDGVLSGHMDLAEHLSDVLPVDEVQQKVGHAYLRAYGRALSAAPENKTVEGKKRAEAARLAGWSNWEAARQAEDRKMVVETYLSFSLPGRCEHAAVALAHDPNLFHLAPSVEEVGAMGTNAMSNQSAMAPSSHMPTPAPAEAAPPSMAAPVVASGGSDPFAVGAMAPAPQTAADSAPPPAAGPAAESVAAVVQPVAATTAPVKPAAKPVKTAPVQADTGPKKPPKGHLLPWFLRGKKYGDDS